MIENKPSLENLDQTALDIAREKTEGGSKRKRSVFVQFFPLFMRDRDRLVASSGRKVDYS